ncbi:hypothetical protein [Acidianus brierleyi]|uniref:Uncharacterized protein n=1 Tax=Acidianus brierleyi TaxID=41673 RepID=A0A2U9ID07_9CREN|nr:hypothetical protein [Acidianus brierleyi]AWR93880.1 hypothetical protein DFR85_03850 [Acidianus brierleyi]
MSSRFVEICENKCCLKIDNANAIIDIEKGELKVKSRLKHGDFIFINDNKIGVVELKNINEIKDNNSICEEIIGKIDGYIPLIADPKNDKHKKLIELLRFNENNNEKERSFYLVIPKEITSAILGAKNLLIQLRKRKGKYSSIYLCGCGAEIFSCRELTT